MKNHRAKKRGRPRLTAVAYQKALDYMKERNLSTITTRTLLNDVWTDVKSRQAVQRRLVGAKKGRKKEGQQWVDTISIDFFLKKVLEF